MQAHGRVTLWSRRKETWTPLWRRTAAVGGESLLAQGSSSPLALISAGRTVTAYDETGRRWIHQTPPGTVTRALIAEDLDGDGREEIAAALGRTFTGRSRGLSVLDWTGREIAAWRDAPSAPVRRWTAGDFDGDGRAELLAVAVGMPGSLLLLRLKAGVLHRQSIALQFRSDGIETPAAADLDRDGAAELIVAAVERGQTVLRVLRLEDRCFAPAGPALTIAGTGELTAAGPGRVALRFKNARGMDYVVIPWKNGRLAEGTRFEHFSTDTVLVQAGPSLEIITTEGGRPAALMRLE